MDYGGVGLLLMGILLIVSGIYFLYHSGSMNPDELEDTGIGIHYDWKHYLLYGSLFLVFGFFALMIGISVVL